MEENLEQIFVKITGSLNDIRGRTSNMTSIKLREIEKIVTGLIFDIDDAIEEVKDLKAQTDTSLTNKDETIKKMSGNFTKMMQEKKEIQEFLLKALKDYQTKAQDVVRGLQEDRKDLKARLLDIKNLFYPPLAYAIYIKSNPDGTVDVDIGGGVGGRRSRVLITEEERKKLKYPGQKVILTPPTQFAPGGNVLQALDEYETIGEEATIDEVLSEGRVRVINRLDQKVVILFGGSLKSKELVPGDKLLCDFRSGLALEKLPHQERSELLLEEIPDNLSYELIGGQLKALTKLREAIELPFAYPDIFRKNKLSPPKGILLYGPPGCGKTLSLKIIASSLKRQLKKKVEILTVRGPQLETMWVGETERKIRESFELAKKKAPRGIFVIIFFDELDAMFRTRGTYVGTDINDKAVTQLSTMMDGVEEYSNIIVIGTSNRPDLIDPSLTRPGRFSPIIEFPRPDEDGSAQIFRVHLDPLVELVHKKYIDESHKEWIEAYSRFSGDKNRIIQELFIPKIISKIYRREESGGSLETEKTTMFEKLSQASGGSQASKKGKVITIQFLETGDTRDIYMKDLISGAIIADIVKRAQLKSALDEINGGEGGLKLEYLIDALEEVFKESESLPNRTDPVSWARILGIPAGRQFRIVEETIFEEDKSKRRAPYHDDQPIYRR